MIIIELYTPDFDLESRTVTKRCEAVLRVCESGVDVLSGDKAWAAIADEIVVNHPVTKKDLRFADDWELWAKTLPEAFRSDMTATVREAPDRIEVSTLEPARPARIASSAGSSA